MQAEPLQLSYCIYNQMLSNNNNTGYIVDVPVLCSGGQMLTLFRLVGQKHKWKWRYDICPFCNGINWGMLQKMGPQITKKEKSDWVGDKVHADGSGVACFC